MPHASAFFVQGGIPRRKTRSDKPPLKFSLKRSLDDASSGFFYDRPPGPPPYNPPIHRKEVRSHVPSTLSCIANHFECVLRIHRSRRPLHDLRQQAAHHADLLATSRG